MQYDLILTDETSPVFPFNWCLWCDFHCHEELEVVLVVLLEFNKFLLHEEIINILVSEYQGQLCAFIVIQSSLDDWVAWENACAFCQHSNLRLPDSLLSPFYLELSIPQILDSFLLPLHPYARSNLQWLQVQRHYSPFRESWMDSFPVNLDHEVYWAFVSDLANGSILSLNEFTSGLFLGGYLCTKYDMVSYGETKAQFRIRERKSEEVSIMSFLDLLR
jgi:hypothetical protein